MNELAMERAIAGNSSKMIIYIYTYVYRSARLALEQRSYLNVKNAIRR